MMDQCSSRMFEILGAAEVVCSSCLGWRTSVEQARHEQCLKSESTVVVSRVESLADMRESGLCFRV